MIFPMEQFNKIYNGVNRNLKKRILIASPQPVRRGILAIAIPTVSGQFRIAEMLSCNGEWV